MESEHLGPEIGGEAEPPPPEDLAGVVTIDKAEELPAICGRVDSAPTWAVVIHAPEGNRQLSTELGMRRLLHHAAEGGKTVAVATRSSSLASRARELNVPVARKPKDIRWDSGGRRVMRAGRFSLSTPSIGRYVQVGVIVGVAFLGLFLFWEVAPSARITAYPPTETVSEVISVIATEGRTDIDFATNAVPATRVSGEQKFTLAIKATGTTQVGVLPARSTVTISNGSAAAILVAAGTLVLATPDFAAFSLDEGATVPAGGSVTVPVTAQKPGVQGNVPAGAIIGWQAERYRFLKVTNAAAAAGGTSEPRQSVDSADVVALQTLAKALENSDSVKQGLISARPNDAIFLGTAESEVTFGDARPAVGTPTDIVLLDVTVKLSALAVVEGTLEALASSVLEGHAAAGTFVPGTIKAVETGARQIDTDSGDIRTEIRIQGELARGVTTEALRDALKGKSESGAKSTLSSQYGIQDADVRLSSWAPRIPRFGFRIDVTLAAREPETGANVVPGNGSTGITTTSATQAAGPGPR